MVLCQNRRRRRWLCGLTENDLLTTDCARSFTGGGLIHSIRGYLKLLYIQPIEWNLSKTQSFKRHCDGRHSSTDVSPFVWQWHFRIESGLEFVRDIIVKWKGMRGGEV